MTTARGGLQRVPPRPSEGCDCPSLCALGPIPARPRLRLFPPSSLPRTHTHTQQTLLEEEKGRPINILPVQAEKGRAAPPTNLCGGGKHRTSSREGDPVAWLPPTPVLYQRLGCATIYGALEAAHQPSSPPLLPFPAAGGALCPSPPHHATLRLPPWRLQAARASRGSPAATRMMCLSWCARSAAARTAPCRRPRWAWGRFALRVSCVPHGYYLYAIVKQPTTHLIRAAAVLQIRKTGKLAAVKLINMEDGVLLLGISERMSRRCYLCAVLCRDSTLASPTLHAPWFALGQARSLMTSSTKLACSRHAMMRTSLHFTAPS